MNRTILITLLILMLLNVSLSFSEVSKIQFSSNDNSLKFVSSKYVSQSQTYQGKLIKVRAYEKIIYVKHPVDSNKQVINIYIPEEYFVGESINGFNTNTAPIFFPNHIGGYMSADPAKFMVTEQSTPNSMNNRTVLYALSKGYIVASAGARGRLTKDLDGHNIGKAPAAIVDLKAAIRYLKFNDQIMPGDANKIISNGTSAGGAISSLLGASGNHPDFGPYLTALGAANASDDIFAVSAYCPIINLENADMAYEWQLSNIHTFDFRGKKGDLNNEELGVSQDLKKMFPPYLNQLSLKNVNGDLLTLDSNGNGNFKEIVKAFIVKSAQKAVDSGSDLTHYSFLNIVHNKVMFVDFDGYMQYIGRMKTPPAFDALTSSSFENNLFGNETVNSRHFTNYSFTHSKEINPQIADKLQINMMNPMHYIGNSNAKVAKNWRIRHGAKDRDTGFAIPLMLSMLLQNKGYTVDFAMPWDKPHSGDYDLDELFHWMDNLCK
ncbi:subtype B tannase [Parasediminibacterium paludis]|uniref:Subtype B tannase n=1 Tax=Parasediminibacterium paludis TaxID=908966 RepID=A0ABV8PVT3_9BACT